MIFDNIEIEIQRKVVRSLRLVVRRDGTARLSVPVECEDESVMDFLHKNKLWLQNHVRQARDCQEKIQALITHRYEEGEMFVFFGKSYSLHLVRKAGPVHVVLKEGRMCLCAPMALASEERRKILSRWYLEQFDIKARILVVQWLKTMNEPELAALRYRFMKSRWGSCQPNRRVVCLNTRLVFYPRECLEEVVVHELCHLKEASHNTHFHALMAHYLPDYRLRTKLLKIQPVEMSAGVL